MVVQVPSRHGGGGSAGPRTRTTAAAAHTPLPPLVRRLALLILAASYCTLLALWSTGGVPDPDWDGHAVHSLVQQRPQYQALRHRGGDRDRGGDEPPQGRGRRRSGEQGSGLKEQRSPPVPVPVSFEGANGLAVPWGGGGVVHEAQAPEQEAAEAAAHQAEAAAGEEETERVRALEDQDQDQGDQEGAAAPAPAVAVPEPPPSTVHVEGAEQGQEQEQQPQPQAKEQEWEWSAAREAAHAEYGVRRFGLQPTRWMGEEEADECSAEDRGQALDFTLVSQTSPDRLWMLAHLCRRWEGPFVLAVYMQDDEAFTEAHEAMLAQAPCPNARILRVRPPPRPSPSIEEGEEAAKWDAVWAQPDQFPVNALRNLAIEEVRTSHFLLTDMDLWPARGMYRLLRRLAAPGAGTRQAFLDPKQALVAPAFGFFGPERLGADGRVYPPDPEDVPGDMPALAVCIDKGECIVFDSQYNLQGHGTTDTGYWMGTQAPMELHPIPCFRSNRYEPYLLLRRCAPTLPPFAEAFTGYGKNKIQHVAHLRFRGFRFSVLPPGAFLIHFPHAPSKSKRSWLGHTAANPNGNGGGSGGGEQRGPSHRQRMDALYDHFLSWAMQERAARAGDTVRLCPQPPPPPPPPEARPAPVLPPPEEAEAVTSVM